MRRRGTRHTGPVPRSARPAELRKPPHEWLLIGVMFFVLPAGLGSGAQWWLVWLLRTLGTVTAVGFIVARVRYRRRRGEKVWIWDRI